MLVMVDPNNKEHVKNIQEFSTKVGRELEIMSSLKRLEPENKELSSNDIHEMMMSIVGRKIQNLAIIQGTRDNKLVELTILNSRDGNYEKNREFAEQITRYSFDQLQAETTVVFSKGEDKILESLGYESLGGEDGLIPYIKDREKMQAVGRKRI